MLPDKIADRVINMKDIDRLPLIENAAKLTSEGIKPAKEAVNGTDVRFICYITRPKKNIISYRFPHARCEILRYQPQVK